MRVENQGTVVSKPLMIPSKGFKIWSGILPTLYVQNSKDFANDHTYFAHFIMCEVKTLCIIVNM